MKEKITPCLWFDNQAPAAAALYQSAFSQTKITAQSPIVTSIQIAGQNFILLDGGPMYQPNPSISFYYAATDEGEVDRAWKALTKGGKVLMPLEAYPWSTKYGWVSDAFGVSWQISLDPAQAMAQKVVPSFLFTGKQFGRAEEAIKSYTRIFQPSSVASIERATEVESPGASGSVKLARFELLGYQFMALDSNLPHPFQFSEGVSLTVYCENQQEIDAYWAALTGNGGQESMCGWLKDPFGVSWQIIPTVLSKIMSDPQKAGKAAKAFMAMRKLNIEQIVQASIS